MNALNGLICAVATLCGMIACINDIHEKAFTVSFPEAQGFLHYDRVVIYLVGDDDGRIDTLFDDKATTLDKLQGLKPLNWKGERAALHLEGFQDSLKTYGKVIAIETAGSVAISSAELQTLHFLFAGKNPLSSSRAGAVSLAISPEGIPYVAFVDAAEMDRAVVFSLDTTTGLWVRMGPDPVSLGAVYQVQLAINASGRVFAAFNDVEDSNRASVVQWEPDPGLWKPVGYRGITPPQASQLALALGPAGWPYLVFKDESQGMKASVVKYDPIKDSWESVGEPGITTGEPNFLSLEVGSDDVPYLGYYDELLFGAATVMRFPSGAESWEVVGEAGFTPGKAVRTQLRLGTGNKPFLAFADAANQVYSTAVMQFQTGAGWTPLSADGMLLGQAVSLSAAFSPQNQFYLAISEYENESRASVVKWDPGLNRWDTVGTAGFSPVLTGNVSLAFGRQGMPWVAFTAGPGHEVRVMKASTDP